MDIDKLAKVLSIICVMVVSLSAPRAEVWETADILLSKAYAEIVQENLIGVLSLETAALRLARQRVVRSDSKLSIKLLSGSEKIYENSEACLQVDHEEKCIKYSLIAYVPKAQTFLLVRTTYDTATYYIVSELGGAETIVSAFPIFSPSARYLALMNVEDPI